MKHGAQLMVDTAGLFGQAGSRFELRTEVKLADVELSDSTTKSTVVDGRLFLDLVLERAGSDGTVFDGTGAEVNRSDSQRSAAEGVLVAGTATGRWSVPCRRCLEPMQGDLVAEISELFEVRPTEGETWPLQEDGIDLGPMLREVALLCFPLAPLCRAECEGPAPDRFPTGPPRWRRLKNRPSVVDPRRVYLRRVI